MNLTQLHAVHEAVLELRTQKRKTCHELLFEVQAAADRVARKFTEPEMEACLAVYHRLPWSDLQKVDVEQTDTSAGDDDVDGAFSQSLAATIINITTLHNCDQLRIDVPVPASQRAWFHWTDSVATRVRQLDAEESVALLVVLEAADAVPVAVLRHDNWWHPAVMLELLEKPEMDWPVGERP